MKTAIAVLLMTAAIVPAAEPTKIELTDVTYEQFDAVVAGHKGKVVVIDVWATFCAPCLKKFPHFVELHEKHAKAGLVCIGACTDPAEDREAALEFLKAKKAHFPNYRFSETNEKISKELKEKYDTDRQPVMFVFDKAGKKVMQFEAKSKPEEIDAFIVKLLESK